MKAIAGWEFYTADFSVPAMSGRGNGRVAFVRDREGCVKWHAMPETMQESGPPLYVYGEGPTLDEAFDKANSNAALAQGFPEDTTPKRVILWKGYPMDEIAPGPNNQSFILVASLECKEALRRSFRSVTRRDVYYIAKKYGAVEGELIP